MTIIRKQELDITPSEHDQILGLFRDSFENYPSDYTFYHQPPHFRFLVWLEENLVGHLGVSFRYARSGSDVLRVYGISELCVSSLHRKKGIAKQLLENLRNEADEKDIDSIISLTDNPDFYLKNGYSLLDQEVKWMMMKNFRSLGIMNRKITDSLVFLSRKAHDLNQYPLDLLGPMY